MKWISTKDKLPECDKTPDSFGVPVAIWPPFEENGYSRLPFAFYGCRSTDEPNFYLYGRVISTPTHWAEITPPEQEGKS